MADQQPPSCDTQIQRALDHAESVIRMGRSQFSVRAVATLLLVVTLCALAFMRAEYSDVFKFVVTSALGAYFGQKTQPRS